MLKRILSVAGMSSLGGLLAIFSGLAPALAQPGQPSPGQMGLQEPVTPVAVAISQFHDLVNIIIFAIAIFVLILMVYVMVRFNEKANPTPSKTTHHVGLEIAWTVIPIFILVIIAVPSFKLLMMQYDYPKPDLTIKATGYQWYWSHEYPDHGGFSFDSIMLDDDERKEVIDKGMSAPRNLAVDNEVVVPVGKVVHVLVTANDVIHNWTIPSFGSKVDAVPGRLTATWFQANREGIYYGQCSELCGKDHAFMPIAVRVVKEDIFNAWADAMKNKKTKEAAEIIRNAVLESEKRRRLASAGAAAE